jgi:hypothetical protein
MDKISYFSSTWVRVQSELINFNFEFYRQSEGLLGRMVSPMPPVSLELMTPVPESAETCIRPRGHCDCYNMQDASKRALQL